MNIVQKAVQAVMKKPVALAPDSWLPGGEPDPLIHRRHGHVGEPVARVDGQLKVKGGARFATEIAMERMVYGALVFSTIPKGRILKSPADYERLVGSFGVRRSNVRFWSVYDTINSTHLAKDPVRSGTLDLTLYALDEK